MTQVGANWNQLVVELYQWQRFGKALEIAEGVRLE